ncbi:MAG: type VI secretion system-associated protein TagF [Pseudomonadota bacterium]
MTVGVFGKLPARRDFVQHMVEPRLMELFDPWLQGAVAQSREQLGESWLQVYLQAPIWRFWLGPKITGKPVLGALMPSVDGVGRYFPLCIIGTFDTMIGPPEIDEQEEWFATVEALMLAALADDGTYEAVQAGITTLPQPNDAISVPVDGGGVKGMFTTLRHAQMRDFYGNLSYWWVPSPDGGATPPRAFVRRGLPSPVEYAMMIGMEHGQTAISDPGGV